MSSNARRPHSRASNCHMCLRNRWATWSTSSARDATLSPSSSQLTCACHAQMSCQAVRQRCQCSVSSKMAALAVAVGVALLVVAAVAAAAVAAAVLLAMARLILVARCVIVCVKEGSALDLARRREADAAVAASKCALYPPPSPERQSMTSVHEALAFAPSAVPSALTPPQHKFAHCCQGCLYMFQKQNQEMLTKCTSYYILRSIRYACCHWSCR